MSKFWPESRLSLAVSSATSPLIGVAFHSMSVSVRDAPYFGIVFILSANGPCSCSGSGHEAAKPSYVTRPSSSASLANSRSVWSLASSSFQYGLVHPPTSAPSVPPGSCMTPSTDTYSAATIFPTRTSTLGAVSLNRVPGVASMAPSERGRLEQKRRLPAARGSRDLGRRSPHETLERPGQMGLVRVPDLTRHVERGHTPAQQLGGPFGPPDLPDSSAGQARGPRHSSFHRARGQTFNIPMQGRRHDRIMYQQTGPNESVDEDVGVVRPRELPSGPIEPERRVRRRRQRQRAVDQLPRRQVRHERAEAELDPEELRVLGDRRRRCLRLRSSHRQPSRAALTRDDHLPVALRHRDEGLLGFTSCLPRLLDHARA